MEHPLLQLVAAVVLLKVVIPLEVLVDLVVEEIGDLHQEVVVHQDKDMMVVLIHQEHLRQVVVAVEQVEQVVMALHHQRLVVQVV